MSDSYSMRMKMNEKELLSGKLNDLIVLKGFELDKAYRFEIYVQKERPCVKLCTNENEKCSVLYYNNMNEVAIQWNPIHPIFHYVKASIEKVSLRLLKMIVNVIKSLIGGSD